MAWNPWAGTAENYQLSIAALVANGTMDAEIAGTLWAAAAEQLSFLTVALPRGAGKTTVGSAVLALRPPGVELHHAYGHPSELETLRRERRGGYLVIGEFSPWPMPSYIWDASVRDVFQTLNHGYSLQSSLHAPDVASAIEVVTRENGVGDAEASHLRLVVHIDARRGPDGRPQRRVDEVFEIDGVSNSRASGRTLFRWNARNDRFEKLAEPENFALDRAALARRRQAIADLAGSGRTALDDVTKLLADFEA